MLSTGNLSLVEISSDVLQDHAKDPVPVSNEVLSEALDVLYEAGDSVDYDLWINIGASLWHQFDGGHEGYELFWEFTLPGYRDEMVEVRWDSLDWRRRTHVSTVWPILQRADEIAGGSYFIDAAGPQSVEEVPGFDEIPVYEDEESNTAITVNGNLDNVTKDELVGAAVDEGDEDNLLEWVNKRVMHGQTTLDSVQPTRWLIEDISEQGSVGITYGESGAYKSFLALDKAHAVATGKQWHGHDTERTGVLIVAGEGNTALAKRALAWAQEYGVDLSEVPIGFTYTAHALDSKEGLQEIAQMIVAMSKLYGIAFRYIIIDTLSTNSVGDENSAVDMGKLLNQAQQLRHKYDATVEIVHHTGKSDKSTARGSYALRANADFMSIVTRKGDGKCLKYACKDEG